MHGRRASSSGKRPGQLNILASLAIAIASLALPVAVLAGSREPAGSQAAGNPGATAGPRPQHYALVTHGRPGTIIKPAVSSAGWAVSYPIQLPPGYQIPTGIAADPGGQGVWLFAQGGSSASPLDTVFHSSGATGPLTEYQLDATNPALQGGAQTPIAVDSSGDAWIGDNRTLVSVDSKTGTVATFGLPDVTIPAQGVGLPTPPPQASAQDFTEIDALAIAPDGSIVIARQFATELQVFHLSTHHVTDMPLPAGTALASLGADIAGQDSGEISAVLYAGQGIHELGQYSQGAWTVSTAPCPAYAVAMTSTKIAVTGPGCIATGSVPGNGPATLTLQPSSGGSGSEDQACAVPLGGGELAMCSQTGLIVARAGTATSTAVPLGQIVSALSSAPGGQAGSTLGALVALPITPGLMSTAGNGELWFLPAQGGTAVGLLGPS